MARLFCAIVCLLLACQTPAPNTSQKDSDEIAVESKKVVDPLKVAAANKAFRQIPMPERSGCGVGTTRAIRSEAAFVELLRVSPSGFRMEAFHSALKNAKIDFEQQTLLLLRYLAGGGGTLVHFGPASLFEHRGSGMPAVLTFRISTGSSGMIGIASVIPYCYAVVVDRSLADMVVLHVDDEAVFAMALDELLPYGQPSTDKQ